MKAEGWLNGGMALANLVVALDALQLGEFALFVFASALVAWCWHNVRRARAAAK